MRIAVALLLLLPGAASAGSICDKYAREMIELSGDPRAIVAAMVQRYKGATDTPGKEIGCNIRLTPYLRGVILGFSRPERGGADGARETRATYVDGGLKPAPTPEPSLGSQGFSMLTSIASGTPNYLIVVGHGETLAVQVVVHKGYQSRDELSAADIERARALVRKALNEPF